MKFLAYLKSYLLYLSIQVVLYLLVSLVLVMAEFSYSLVLLLGMVWFLPMLGFMLVHYLRHHRYLTHLQGVYDALDQKYLLPEVMDSPPWVEQQQTHDMIKALGRVMHEEIKYYRDIQRDYREYIELWVHEIKTPIASSLLVVENDQNETTKKIERQLHAIEDGIEQVLYYAKSSDVSKDFLIQSFSLETLLKQTIKRNAKDMIQQHMHVVFEMQPCTIASDPKWLGFILHQIIGNAMKYTKKQSSTLTLRIQQHKHAIVCEIQDEGIGIAPQDLPRVFDKGFTGGNGRLFAKSTGMGLYLCKTCADRLGIQLQIESIQAKGTLVRLIIPKAEQIV
ncbi:MAG: sensor histidine kinase [Erysipelotrichaceae bacterium]